MRTFGLQVRYQISGSRSGHHRGYAGLRVKLFGGALVVGVELLRKSVLWTALGGGRRSSSAISPSRRYPAGDASHQLSKGEPTDPAGRHRSDRPTSSVVVGRYSASRPPWPGQCCLPPALRPPRFPVASGLPKVCLTWLFGCARHKTDSRRPLCGTALRA